MALPERVQVKLSSEAAEYVAMTPVLNQQLPFRELLEHIATVARKQPGRVREIVKRGSLVSGASRFRWNGWELTDDDLASALSLLPDPDPALPFETVRLNRAVVTGMGLRAVIEREAGSARKMFQSRSFWDTLLTEAGPPSYFDYSYRERADIFRCLLTDSQRDAIRNALDLLKYKDLAARLRITRLETVEWHQPR
jgi:hypothetical protein